jgi:disulfide bond formation protein DsbB
MMYTMSLAFDPVASSLYTVTVPNTQTKRLVISRFDRSDLTLSEEYSPALDPASGLQTTGPQRSLHELYVTGATVADGRLYAISAAYSTLIAVDLTTHRVVAAHAIPGLERPSGLAIRGNDLYIVGEGGSVSIVGKPGG